MTDIENLYEAMDIMRERICVLEQKIEEDEKIEYNEKIIKKSDDVLKRCNQLLQRVQDIETRITSYISDIVRSYTAISNTLRNWAEYFAMKPTLNLRRNDEEKCNLSEQLKEEAKRLESYIGEEYK